MVLGSIRFLVPSICFRVWNRRGEGRGARKHRGRGVLKTSHKKVRGRVHKINLRTESLCCKNFLFLKICKIPNNINARYNILFLSHFLFELEKFKRCQTMLRLHDYVKTIAHKTWNICKWMTKMWVVLENTF